MYVVPPPKSSDSITDGSAELQTYQTWKGSNVFLLQGRLIFGPDVRSIFLTIFLIVTPVAIFCSFIGRKLMDEYSDSFGISIMVVTVVFTIYVLVLLLLTSGRDPGIIPRNAHPPEPESYDESSEVGAYQTPPLRLPRIKDVVVNGTTVKIKYAIPACCTALHVVRTVQYATTVWSDSIITALGLDSVLDCGTSGSSSCLSPRQLCFAYMSLGCAGSSS